MSSVWRRRVESGVRGAAEVIFPENAIGAPDWRSARVVETTMDYLDDLPPHRGRLVGALFASADVALPPLLRSLGPLPRVPLAKRKEAFSRWYDEPYSALGQIVGALKATLCMSYFSHPDVVRHIGTRKVCDRPWDAYQVDVEPDLLERMHAAEGAGVAS